MIGDDELTRPGQPFQPVELVRQQAETAHEPDEQSHHALHGGTDASLSHDSIRGKESEQWKQSEAEQGAAHPEGHERESRAETARATIEHPSQSRFHRPSAPHTISLSHLAAASR